VTSGRADLTAIGGLNNHTPQLSAIRVNARFLRYLEQRKSEHESTDFSQYQWTHNLIFVLDRCLPSDPPQLKVELNIGSYTATPFEFTHSTTSAPFEFSNLRKEVNIWALGLPPRGKPSTRVNCCKHQRGITANQRFALRGPMNRSLFYSL